jgi:hypothetical protein
VKISPHVVAASTARCRGADAVLFMRLGFGVRIATAGTRRTRAWPSTTARCHRIRRGRLRRTRAVSITTRAGSFASAEVVRGGSPARRGARLAMDAGSVQPGLGCGPRLLLRGRRRSDILGGSTGPLPTRDDDPTDTRAPGVLARARRLVPPRPFVRRVRQKTDPSLLFRSAQSRVRPSPWRWSPRTPSTT